VIPRFDQSEPLRAECRHFIECIQSGATPLTDGEEALRVVQVLEAAQTSLARSGEWIELGPASEPAHVRPAEPDERARAVSPGE
jgi:UDP-2-acetamido-3-amino-2,3-dideoxy-glucuronate N-acetyltransferase